MTVGIETTIKPFRKSDAPNFFSMMRAIIPAERSLNAQVKSPTSRNTNSTTNPAKV